MDEELPPATPEQWEYLRARGYRIARPLTEHEADMMIRRHRREWRNFYPTDRQIAVLRRHGLWREGITRGEASRLIDQIITKDLF